MNVSGWVPAVSWRTTVLGGMPGSAKAMSMNVPPAGRRPVPGTRGGLTGSSAQLNVPAASRTSANETRTLGVSVAVGGTAVGVGGSLGGAVGAGAVAVAG